MTHAEHIAGVEQARTPPLHIGRTPTPDELEAVDLTVLPGGAGLPTGHGTAEEGKPLYAARCAMCHGLNGEGLGDYAALVGGRGSLESETPVLTVGSYWPYATTVFDYIRRAMPYDSPGSLSDHEVYALTAWILYANDIINEKMIVDRATLPRIRMPNRDGFIADPRPDVGSVKATSSSK
ncbi:MAG TPA: cytochrome c [Steroidobacter sp.]|nr:cytochrome c [Steroidobacter sp.]